jgi:NADPH-dependent curcumin reductase CurA
MNNRQVILAQRPVGMIDENTTQVTESPQPVCGANEALIKVGVVSIDPTIRTWMNDAPGYMAPIKLGDVVRSGGVGEVVQSMRDDYQVGDIVYGMTGWQEWVVASDANKFQVIPTGLGLDIPVVMGALGTTGLTAYFGLLDVGQFKSGDVVVVSGAGGATGSVVGQLAKARGAKKVVGIAGGAQKCAEIVEEYGFDECLDYREENLSRRLRTACPNGIDVYFDNVGGEILDAALANIAMHGRIVVCGAISQYNAMEKPKGVANTPMLIMQRARMEGFLIFDFAARFLEAQMELATMIQNGTLVHHEHLIEGLENASVALNLLFSGANHGKTLVVVDNTVQLG